MVENIIQELKRANNLHGLMDKNIIYRIHSNKRTRSN